MKYKVGDKVKVRSDLEVGREYGCDSFTLGMMDHLGKTVTIFKANKQLNKYEVEKGYWYNWTDEMFEGLAEPEPIKAYELMKLAAENPQKYEGKRYRNLTYALDSYGKNHEQFHINGDGEFIDNGMLIYIQKDTTVEEIPQSVPFAEARKAHEEGKVVIAKFPDFNSGRMLAVRYWKDSDGSDKCDLDGCELSFYIIRTAEWYIVEKEGSK